MALGSNLGDRAGFLLGGLVHLSATSGVGLARLSPIYETEPVGPAGQGRYLNQVMELRTSLGPRRLLAALLKIEASLGRVRSERFGPRTLDLDLLLLSTRVEERPGLVLPHPRMLERAFVLVPLVDMIPEGVHPVGGKKYRCLLAGLDQSGVGLWQPKGLS